MRPEQDAFFEKLYNETFRQLWIYAMAKLHDSDRAEEVVQDTFHEAVKQLDKLMAHENPKGWLKETLKHKIMHAERSMNRYLLRFISLDTDVPYEDSVLASYDKPSDNSGQVLKEIQEVLTKDEWILLRKIAIEKIPYKIVAAELGITVWTCQKRVQRIREKLKRNFLDYFN